MTFGNGYVNKHMFDFESDWTEERFREWASEFNFDVANLSDNLRHYRQNGDNSGRPILMVYTPRGNEDHNRLNGYFIPRQEALEVYAPEGWELISSTPEEIIV